MKTSFYTTGDDYSGEGRIFEVQSFPKMRKFRAVEVDGSDGERCIIGNWMFAETYRELMRKMEGISRSPEKISELGELL